MTKTILAAGMAAALLGAANSAAQTAAPPSCDKCADLPKLEEELLQQEFLKEAFKDYIPGATDYTYTASSVADLQAKMKNRFNKHFGGAEGGASGASGEAAFGTDTTSRSCALVEYVKGPDGKNVKGPDGKDKTVPFDEKKLRAKECKVIADYLIAHERQHQKTCQKAWKDGTQDDFTKPDFVAADDYKAYEAGIKVLREHIAKLAGECGWQGSTQKLKPSGSAVVPTKDEIEKLKGNTRKVAQALRKGKKK